MLSPDTIRTLTSWLMTATEPSPSTAPPGHPAAPDITAATAPAASAAEVPPQYALLVLHDGDAVDAPPGTRCLAASAVTIHPALVATYQRGLVDLLPDLAAAFAPSAHAAPWPDALSTLVRQRAAKALTGVLAAPQPGMRLLACAIAYDDIHTDIDPGGSGQVELARRIDAVDVDGRVYQAIRLPGVHATVLVDDEPDPLDTPATYAGLAALVTAAVERASTTPADS